MAHRLGRDHAMNRQDAPERDRLGLVGTLVDGRYLVEREVGAGGFGIVYRARHIRFDSAVALKVMTRDAGGQQRASGAARHGTHEGRLLFQLAALHPAFVRVFEAGTVDCGNGNSLPYLAMEWLDGITLKTHVSSLYQQQTRLPLSGVLHLVDDLAQAIAIAHSRGIAHRDLKPANVFLSVQGQRVFPKLLDFGLAKIGGVNIDACDDSCRDSRAFTPAYAAPEQWHHRVGATGPWTDVYSFALLLVEVLTGQSWCHGISSTELSALALDAANRPTPRRFALSVSDQVEAVFSRALSVDPRDRYRAMDPFWSELCSAVKWRRPAESLDIASISLLQEEQDSPISGGTRKTQMPPPSSGTAHPPIMRSDGIVAAGNSALAHADGVSLSTNVGASRIARDWRTSWRPTWSSASVLAGAALVTALLLWAASRAQFQSVPPVQNPSETAAPKPLSRPLSDTPAESKPSIEATVCANSRMSWAIDTLSNQGRRPLQTDSANASPPNFGLSLSAAEAAAPLAASPARELPPAPARRPHAQPAAPIATPQTDDASVSVIQQPTVKLAPGTGSLFFDSALLTRK